MKYKETLQKFFDSLPNVVQEHRKFVASPVESDTGNKWIARFIYVFGAYALFNYFNFDLSTVFIAMLITHFVEFGLWMKLGEPDEYVEGVFKV